jgi:MFS transporter, PPP family, 3-phenylpropionic acid transporter
MPNSVRVTIFIMLAHLSLGAVMPYLPVWLEETKGLSGSQIGVVLASASFGRIIIGPLAAAWAEGRSDRRTPLIVFALGLFFGYATFPFLGAFWPIALSCFATGVMFQCLMAFTEAATLRATEGSKHWPYGRARAAASTAFVIASLGAGWVIQEFGVPAVYIWFLSACALSAYWAFQMQPDPVAERSTKRLTERLIGGFGLFSRPTFLLGVMGASLIQAAHAFYYGFRAPYG